MARLARHHMFSRPIPVMRTQRRKAEEYFKRGCDDGNEPRSCFNLSTLYLVGGDPDVNDKVICPWFYGPVVRA